MYILQSYQSYHKMLDENKDTSTFSIAKLNLDESKFEDFQSELNALVKKYYDGSQNDSRERTVSLVIIP